MRIGIAGLGYVGLPLGVAFGEAGHEVVGFDINSRRVENLNRGESDIEDVPSSQLAGLGDSFAATTDPADLGRCDAIMICVPTPLANYREPDLSYITSSAQTLASVITEGQTIILESTTYPGTTRDHLLPLLEESGLRAGRDFHLAFSPERIDPGREDHTVKNTPKVVGGLTPECAAKAAEVYELICDEVVIVSSPEAAELTKLLENIFRSVNIALVNELSQLTDRLGIDIWEVVDAAATKPFGFMKFEPGPGMGGHCLPIDPFYLAFKAREHDFVTEFVELAGKVNQGHPEFCVGKIERALDQQAGLATSRSKVLILGVSYKAGVADLREAPALKIIRRLRDLGADVSYHDPIVPALPQLGLESVDYESGIAEADAVALITAHPQFDIDALLSNAELLIDFRGVTRGREAANLVRL